MFLPFFPWSVSPLFSSVSALVSTRLAFWVDTVAQTASEMTSTAPLKIGNTSRRVSVLVAVLCFSRLCYIEFSLAERKEDFYRCVVNALEYFGGLTRKIIFDNLKAAVLSGSASLRFS